MRVLVYSNCRLDPALGSGKTRTRFSAGLRELGHVVRTVEPHEFVAWPSLRSGQRFRMAYGSVRHALRVLHESPYDVVELNGGEFGWLALRLRRKRRRPLLVHRTDGCELLADKSRQRDFSGKAGGRQTVASRFHRSLDRASFRAVDACVTLSDLDRDYLVSQRFQPPDRTLVARPGLDNEFLNVPEPSFRPLRVTFLGSWIDRKGIDVLVPAASAILVQHPDVTLDLLGTAETPTRIRAQFPPAVQQRVEIAGLLSRDQLAQRLASAAIFVLPSRYEGYGMATAEAMACGCAVVTTRTGFGADLKDGENALVVGFNDAAAVREAISRLIDNTDLRLKVACAGWNLVRSHRWAASSAEIGAAYARWLTEHQKGAMRHP